MSNGTAIPNTTIAVDFWHPKSCSWVKHFFLSHMHSDHIHGLKPSWRYPIYCSEITKKLLIHKLGINEKLINSIEIGVPRIISDRNENNVFTVTLFDANHCPGAVMFLFEGVFGRILYTADFRCDGNMLEELRSCQIGKVDTLYVDNTYFDKNMELPAREEATKEILKIIRKHPEFQILIICYTLGKEDLLLKIANELQEWIIVSQEKLAMLKVLEMPNVFTENVHDGRIRASTSREMYKFYMKDWIKAKKTIAIFPTGLFTKHANPYHCNFFEDIFFIPYSDHSSYTEIQQFIGLIKPTRVLPIVKSKGSDKNSTQNIPSFHHASKYSSNDDNSSNNKSTELNGNVNISGKDKAKKKLLEKKRSIEILMKRKRLSKGVVFDAEMPGKALDGVKQNANEDESLDNLTRSADKHEGNSSSVLEEVWFERLEEVNGDSQSSRKHLRSEDFLAAELQKNNDFPKENECILENFQDDKKYPQSKDMKPLAFEKENVCDQTSSKNVTENFSLANKAILELKLTDNVSQESEIIAENIENKKMKPVSLKVKNSTLFQNGLCGQISCLNGTKSNTGKSPVENVKNNDDDGAFQENEIILEFGQRKRVKLDILEMKNFGSHQKQDCDDEILVLNDTGILNSAKSKTGNKAKNHIGFPDNKILSEINLSKREKPLPLQDKYSTCKKTDMCNQKPSLLGNEGLCLGKLNTKDVGKNQKSVPENGNILKMSYGNKEKPPLFRASSFCPEMHSSVSKKEMSLESTVIDTCSSKFEGQKGFKKCKDRKESTFKQSLLFPADHKPKDIQTSSDQNHNGFRKRIDTKSTHFKNSTPDHRISHSEFQPSFFGRGSADRGCHQFGTQSDSKLHHSREYTDCRPCRTEISSADSESIYFGSQNRPTASWFGNNATALKTTQNDPKRGLSQRNTNHKPNDSKRSSTSTRFSHFGRKNDFNHSDLQFSKRSKEKDLDNGGFYPDEDCGRLCIYGKSTSFARKIVEEYSDINNF